MKFETMLVYLTLKCMSLDLAGLESSSCKKQQKSLEQETGLGNRGRPTEGSDL